METLTLNAQQQRRADILHRLAAHKLTQEQAAHLLGVSQRQIRRLAARFAQDGLSSVVHGNSARPPKHKTSAEVIAQVQQWSGADGVYHDFNTCHLHEKLTQEHDVQIGRSTLDRLLKAQQLRLPRHEKPRVTRKRRERCPREGQMLQLDASPHDWLQGRGPRLTLVGAIDDATSKIVHIRFHASEDQAGYLQMLRAIAQTHGLPESVYHDKHTILRSPKQATLEDELAGKEPQSQVQQVLDLLGVTSLVAHSPQAKGRIERLWQTLQERLSKEMRVANVCTHEQANAFLPAFVLRHNLRFAQPPQDPQAAWVSVQADLDWPYYIATRHSRMVRADHTLAWQGQCVQIVRTRGERSLGGQRIMVHTTPEGEVFAYDGKQRLQHKLLAGRPAVAAKEDAQTPASPASPTAGAKQRAWLFANIP